MTRTRTKYPKHNRGFSIPEDLWKRLTERCKQDGVANVAGIRRALEAAFDLAELRKPPHRPSNSTSRYQDRFSFDIAPRLWDFVEARASAKGYTMTRVVHEALGVYLGCTDRGKPLTSEGSIPNYIGPRLVVNRSE